MKKAVFAFACILLALTMLVRLSSSATYDPWVDLDESGTINIFDVVMLANSYQTSGDPARNVNVANWPTALPVNITGYATDSGFHSRYLDYNEYWQQSIATAGYRRITVGFEVTADVASVEVSWDINGVLYPVASFNIVPTYTLKTYDVSGEALVLEVTNGDWAIQYIYIDYFLTM